MGQVSISIRGRQYQIACDDGQEAHLARLGRYLDQQAEDLVKQAGSINEPLMMVMIALTIADQLTDANEKIDTLTADAVAAQAQIDTGTAGVLTTLAKRIEDIAASLERP
ncbi:MAG: cell division protein ZapA [Rhodospirillaceae bacterium]|nr:cell division protein ZapA [Rhodospirillaceae bacterium]